MIVPGHSLRISVSSSNYPRFSINPNNGLLLADPLYPGTNVTAIQTIYHSPKFPSRISLPIVKKHQLPEVHVLKEVQRAYPDQFTSSNMKKFAGYITKMITRGKKSKK